MLLEWVTECFLPLKKLNVHAHVCACVCISIYVCVCVCLHPCNIQHSLAHELYPCAQHPSFRNLNGSQLHKGPT